MLALWWLLGIAFFRRPNEVVTVGLILMLFVLGSLIHESIPTLVVRTFSFIISTMLATMFAAQKSRANERLMQITKIIQLVPANVVAADAHGTIIAANDRAANMIGETFQPICGHLFTDLFMQHYQPSTALRVYKEWFQRTGEFECEIRLHNHQNIQIIGNAECSGSGQSRILVVIFNQVV